jgi:hypothetical protein
VCCRDSFIFNKAFDEVHRSNMSKCVNNNEELLNTLDKYSKENIIVYSDLDVSFPKPVYRSEDNKVLKSINYSPANLKQFIDE